MGKPDADADDHWRPLDARNDITTVDRSSMDLWIAPPGLRDVKHQDFKADVEKWAKGLFLFCVNSPLLRPRVTQPSKSL